MRQISYRYLGFVRFQGDVLEVSFCAGMWGSRHWENGLSKFRVILMAARKRVKV